MYHINALQTLNLHSVICQSYMSITKVGGKKHDTESLIFLIFFLSWKEKKRSTLFYIYFQVKCSMIESYPLF